MIKKRKDEKLTKGNKYIAEWEDPFTHEKFKVEYTVDRVYENKTLDGSPGATIIIATGRTIKKIERGEKRKAGGRKQHG